MKIFIACIFITLSFATSAQKTKSYNAIASKDSIAPVGIIKNISDSALLDVVQRQTFRYFWHFAHPVSGLARERDNTVHGDYYWDYINEAYDEPNFSKDTYGPEACAIGGTGFGILSTIVAVNRGWIGRDTALKRLVKIVDFLNNADSYHGIFPHFMNGATGKTIPFGSLTMELILLKHLICLWDFYVPENILMAIHRLEKYFRNRVTQLWDVANWNWHTNGGNALLYWHWSPTNDFDMNFPDSWLE